MSLYLVDKEFMISDTVAGRENVPSTTSLEGQADIVLK
jgi:hypothetical protein